MAKVEGKFEENPDDWVIMQTASTKEFIRCRRHRVSYLLSVGWKLAWDVYREKFYELEKTKTQLMDDLEQMKSDIEEVENK